MSPYPDYLPTVGPPAAYPRTPRRSRAVFAALAVSIACVLLYYMSQAFAQLLYALVLVVGDIARASAADGFQMADLQVDMAAVLGRVERNYTIVAALYAAFLIGAYALFIASRGKGKPDYIQTGKPRGLHIPAAVAVAFGMLGTANLLYEAMVRLAEKNDTIGRMLSDYDAVVGTAFTSDAGVGWLVVGICVLVPIAEELLFRGIIQGELSAVMSPWLAVFIQAVLFSAFHMQAVQSLYVFLPGLAMGLAYLASRSIWIPILMHMVFNFLGSGALIELTGGDPAVDAALYAAQYGAILVGVLCLAWMFLSRQRAKPPVGKDDAGPMDEYSREEPE